MPNWSAVLEEIKETERIGDTNPHDSIRRKYLQQLHGYTKRTVIAYYSGFLSKARIAGLEINDDDKNGFMMCIHETDEDQGLDLILHTPGGDVAATESLIYYLKQIYGRNIRAFVPLMAMSAGTILACACQSIVMGKQSSLGPIDPQLNGIPAFGVIEEIKRAYRDIREDEKCALIWNPILSRLMPSFVQQCHWVLERTKEYGEEVLRDNMLAENKDRDRLSSEIAARLSDLSQNKAHDRHIHYQDAKDMGLNIEVLEDDSRLQDLVLTVHHCYMHTLGNTPAFKIIENHKGRAFIRMIA